MIGTASHLKTLKRKCTVYRAKCSMMRGDTEPRMFGWYMLARTHNATAVEFNEQKYWWMRSIKMIDIKEAD